MAKPNGMSCRAVEAENIAFNSTLVVNGEAWGVVIRTGDHTLIGQIAALTGGESGNKSPLSVEIHHFVALVSTVAIIFAIVFFIVGITTAYKGQASLTYVPSAFFVLACLQLAQCHVCGQCSGGLCARRSPLGCHAPVSRTWLAVAHWLTFKQGCLLLRSAWQHRTFW